MYRFVRFCPGKCCKNAVKGIKRAVKKQKEQNATNRYDTIHLYINNINCKTVIQQHAKNKVQFLSFRLQDSLIRFATQKRYTTTTIMKYVRNITDRKIRLLSAILRGKPPPGRAPPEDNRSENKTRLTFCYFSGSSLFE